MRRPYASQHYLVTAAHVLDERIASNQLEQIGIRLDETSGKVSNLGKCHIETFRPIGPFDAAIIRFEQPELIAALQSGRRFLTPRDLSPIRADMPNCLVAGYPVATSRKMGWDFSAKFFCYGSRLLFRANFSVDQADTNNREYSNARPRRERSLIR
jgi:hypothetical protein